MRRIRCGGENGPLNRRVIFFIILMVPVLSFCKMRILENVAVSNFPARLIPYVDLHPIHEGFLDVTQPPYNATGNGLTNDAWAIQAAINDAYDSNLIVFFPGNKTYLCESKLRCIQDPVGSWASQRKFSHKLVGSTTGTPPVLKLADGTWLESNTFVRFAYEDAEGPDASRHYCAELKNLCIDMGDNPTATAIEMHGAQHCTIQNVEIYGADFNIGLNGLPGSGGSVVNSKVTGGQIGIYENSYRPNPGLTGVRLIGQAQYGIQTGIVRGPLVVTGFYIESPESPDWSYRAIRCASTFVSEGVDPSVGNLVLIDGAIKMRASSRKAIYNYDQDCYFENVYIDAGTLIESGIRYSPIESVSGSVTGQWDRLTRYTFASGSDDSWVVTNGVATNAFSDWVSYTLETNAVCSSNLIAGLIDQHIDPEYGPSWESSAIIDITDSNFGATPDDDSDDDALAIQKALDGAADPGHEWYYGKAVFIPRGHFHVKSPITVPAGAELFGAGNTISVLHVDPDWELSSAASVLQTESDSTVTVYLADFAILGADATPSVGTESQKFLRYATVDTGFTIWKDIQLSQRELYQTNNVQDEPIIKIGPNGGGKFYNLCEDNVRQPDDVASVSTNFHILHIFGSTNPLYFYQASVEHQGEGPAQVCIEDAENVHFYGLKYEKEHRLMDIVDSSSVSVCGGSGNYSLMNAQDSAIISITNSSDITLACLSRKPLAGEQSGKKWVQSDVSISDDYSIALYSIPPVQPAQSGLLWVLLARP